MLFRSLRIDLAGDTPFNTIDGTGACAAASPAGIAIVSATANVFRAGTQTSVTLLSQPLSFGALQFPGMSLAPGTVVATDASNNLFQVIWPSIAGLAPGPPIYRLQLSAWNSWVRTGQKIDVSMRFTAMAADGVPASYTVDAVNIVIPGIK